MATEELLDGGITLPRRSKKDMSRPHSNAEPSLEAAALAIHRSYTRASDALRNSTGEVGRAALLARALACTKGARVSFVADDIIAQRYVEIDGHLQKVVAVVEMRGSDHATDVRRYELTPSGAVIGEPLSEYHGITTGVPSRDTPAPNDVAAVP